MDAWVVWMPGYRAWQCRVDTKDGRAPGGCTEVRRVNTEVGMVMVEVGSAAWIQRLAW